MDILHGHMSSQEPGFRVTPFHVPGHVDLLRDPGGILCLVEGCVNRKSTATERRRSRTYPAWAAGLPVLYFVAQSTGAGFRVSSGKRRVRRLAGKLRPTATWAFPKYVGSAANLGCCSRDRSASCPKPYWLQTCPKGPASGECSSSSVSEADCRQRPPCGDPVGFTKWRRAAVIAVAITAFLLPAHAAFAATLELDGTIRTSPFTGSSVSMGDNEGSAFVPSDNSLWLADDGKKQDLRGRPDDRSPEADDRTERRSTTPRGSAADPAAGTDRTNDFESIAYDRANDVLYVFSGTCCTSSILPTAFRLTRQSGQFQVESYQPLPTGADYTGAAWSPTDGKIYVGKGRDMRSFDYASGTASPSFRRGRGQWDHGNGLLARRGGSLRHGEQRNS